MSVHLKPILAVMAITLSVAGAASAYTYIERNDNNQYDGDASNDYGDASGYCANGTTFTVYYQTDASGRLYFTDLENRGSDEGTVIRRECDE